MTILAIETSNPRGSLAVVRDGVVIFVRTFISERSHNSQLFAPLGEALAVCGAELQGIVAGLGPGSYTGARIGIAAAQGIALSRNIPVFGLPSVLAPDVADLPAEFVVCGDARRGSYFTAEIRERRLVGEIELHNAEALRIRRATDRERAWFSFDEIIPLSLPDVQLAKPSAVLLAKLAADPAVNKTPRVLEPIYLAGAFVTQPKKH
jgi:tRNA threonylcarbamoyladenosine biosynthesis protein TsaB